MIKIGTDVDLARFNRKMVEMEQRVRQGNRRIQADSRGIGASMAAGLGSLKSGLGQLGLGIGGVGALAGLKGILQRADDFADLSLQLNESAESLQRIDQVAQLTASIGVEDLAKAFLRLEKNLGDEQYKDAAVSLANLGISAQDLMAVPLEQKLMLMSDAFDQARRDGTGVNDLMDLLGRSAGDLIPMLAQGSVALREMFDNAGPLMTDEDVQRMAELNDQFDQYVMKVKGFAASSLGKWFEGTDLFAEMITDAAFGMNPLEEYDFRERAKEQEAADREAARAEQARKLQEMQEAAAKAAEEKLTQATAEKNATRVEKSREQIDDLRIDALPAPEKLAALKQKLSETIAGALSTTGLEGMAGLKFMATLADADSGTPGQQAEMLDALVEALEIEREIAALRKEGAAEIETLRDQVEKGRYQLLSPTEQAAQLRRELSESLGIDIDGARDVERGLRDLQAEAKAAAAAGDVERERAALERLRAAQEDAVALAGLDTGTRAGAAGGGTLPPMLGEVGRTFNLLFGRPAGESPELSEARVQTGLFRNMDRVLGDIRDLLSEQERDVFVF